MHRGDPVREQARESVSILAVAVGHWHHERRSSVNYMHRGDPVRDREDSESKGVAHLAPVSLFSGEPRKTGVPSHPLSQPLRVRGIASSKEM